MPYIKQEIRGEIDPAINALIADIRKSCNKQINYGQDRDKYDDFIEGVLNYTITRIMLNTIKTDFTKLRYKHINRITGVLMQVLDEFNRRVKDKYEAKATETYGDLREYEDIF